jgi:hypothetical protein
MRGGHDRAVYFRVNFGKRPARLKLNRGAPFMQARNVKLSGPQAGNVRIPRHVMRRGALNLSLTGNRPLTHALSMVSAGPGDFRVYPVEAFPGHVLMLSLARG